MFYKLNKLFHRDTYRIRLSLHMKSGKTIEVLCDDFTHKSDRATGSLSEYSISGARAGDMTYISMGDVEAISYKKA